MKNSLKILFSLILLAIFTLPQTVQGSDKGAKIEFAERTHDFGIIHEGNGKVSCEFEFTNTGNEPLIIYGSTATCGCTRPTFPNEPIAPGAKGKISVTYNPAHREGEITSTVTVRCNAKKNKKIILKLTGNVVK